MISKLDLEEVTLAVSVGANECQMVLVLKQETGNMGKLILAGSKHIPE